MSQVTAAQHMDAHAAVCLAAEGIVAQSSTSLLWSDGTLCPVQGVPQDGAGDVAGLQSCLQACKSLLDVAWSEHVGHVTLCC